MRGCYRHRGRGRRCGTIRRGRGWRRRSRVIHRRAIAAFQFDIAGFCVPRLFISIQLSAYFLTAIGGNSVQTLAFSGTRRRQSYTGIGVAGLLRLHVEKLRRLKVAVPFRDIAQIIE